jgi:hypothetical protein
MRTYEQIEKDINNIRREIKECIVATLNSKGYGINQITYGRKYSIQMQYDEEHTCFCLSDDCYPAVAEPNWRHIDFASMDELMELYATALRAIPR